MKKNAVKCNMPEYSAQKHNTKEAQHNSTEKDQKTQRSMVKHITTMSTRQGPNVEQKNESPITCDGFVFLKKIQTFSLTS